MRKAKSQDDIGSLIKELDAQLPRARQEGTHAVVELLAEKRQCLLAQAKARKEKLEISKLPPDWDNLLRWIISGLRPYPEALEAFLKVFDQYEDGTLPEFGATAAQNHVNGTAEPVPRVKGPALK